MRDRQAEPRELQEISVQELVDRCNQAASEMGVSNPHRLVILNVGRALVEVTTRLELERTLVSPLISCALAIAEFPRGSVPPAAVDELRKAIRDLTEDAPQPNEPRRIVALPGVH